MDSALNKNQSELAVLILSISLQVLSDVDGFFDEVVKVLRNLRSKSVLLQDSEDLIACDSFDLRDSVVVPKNDSDLRGRSTLLGQFHNLFHQLTC